MLLLTSNEGDNIALCLASLRAQTSREFEVLVVTNGGDPRAAALVRSVQARFPVPIRLEQLAGLQSRGELRNAAVLMARAPFVALISPDAELDPTWVDYALRSLERCDVVYGRQVHAPLRWTTAAAVRGLRYHFPKKRAEDPLLYASNVAAAYHREILRVYPFDPMADAAEDLLIARRAHKAGYRVQYNPSMVAYHHDVVTSEQEMRKSREEGQGWGAHREELGLFAPILAWAVVLVIGVLLVLVRPMSLTILLLMSAIWLPALRRGFKRLGQMPLRQVLRGVCASPLYDLTFLLNYVRGLLRQPKRAPEASETPTEARA